MSEAANSRFDLARPLWLDAGIVAFNEEATVGAAIDSLLGQTLPAGVRWGNLWVVTSGCTDRTDQIVSSRAARDPRVRLLSEPDRRGKSHALVQVLEHARGDAVVLLNSDAVAEPGAVTALLQEAHGAAPPFGVMGRPCVPAGSEGALDRTVDLLWAMHHEFHLELRADGGGTHLSDELLLVSLPAPPVLREGIINDGAFLGAWLSLHGGTRRYADDARVRIDVPRSAQDHLRQRRRIHVGDRQIAATLGVRPSTFAGLALRSPRRALAVARRSLKRSSRAASDLLLLSAGELVASALAAWDWAVPRKDHVRWDRIARAAPVPEPTPVSSAPDPSPPTPLSAGAERRLRTLLEIAGQFGTGISLEELCYLLPSGGPEEPAALHRTLADRPDLARLDGGRAFAPGSRPDRLDERQDRAARYREQARELVDRHLRPVQRLLCCLGITGSTAYGEPEPGDDLDLFVVSRPGSQWVFLAYTYLAVRLRFQPRGDRERPVPCLNLVLDETTARREFARPHDLLFAREALSTQMLVGEEYYRRLLGSATWAEAELPRLYRREAVTGPLPAVRPAPAAVRALNALLFPGVAAYLQAVGLRRNAAFRRAGRPEAAFRTRTTPGRLAFESMRFQQLAGAMASPPSPVGAPMAPSPRPTSYR
jgi:Glycosyl transferase family 2